jgi:type IV pilus assembly protein PilQ
MSSGRSTDRVAARARRLAALLVCLACGTAAAEEGAGGAARWIGPPGEIRVGEDGQARSVFRPEFRGAPGLHVQLNEYGIPGLAAQLVAPLVAVPKAPGARQDPAPVMSRLLLRGPVAAVRRAREVLARLDAPRRAVFVSVLVSEVECWDRFNRGGSLNLDKGAGTDPKPTFFRGFSTQFEPDDYLRSTLTGASAFEGTTLRFADMDVPGGGAFEFTLRMLLKQGTAEFLAWPNLLCNEEEPGVMRALRIVPQVLLVERPADNPGFTVQNPEVGLVLIVKPLKIGVESARLELDVSLKLPEEIRDASAPPGSILLKERQVRTTLTVRDREPLLVGGLYIRRGERSRGGLPRPAALSALDPLHSSRLRDCRSTEITFLIRARIVEPCRRPPELYPDGYDAWLEGRTPRGAVVRSPWADVPAGAKQLDESVTPPDRR